MTNIKAQIQKLSPSPGDLVIITVPEDVDRETVDAVMRHIGSLAENGGYYVALTSAPLTVEHLNNEEGRRLVKQLAAALENTPSKETPNG